MASKDDDEKDVAPAADPKPAPKPRKRPKKAPAPVAPEDDPDALMASTLQAMEWARKRRTQLLYGLAIVVGIGGIVFAISFYRAHREEQASALIHKGVMAELAPIKKGDEDPEVLKRIAFFGSEDEKQKAALAAYADARAKFADTGPGILARLGEAGVRLDRKEYDEALAAYTEVRSSSLGSVDANIKLRCLEGIAYAHEGKGRLDDARRSFEELMNLDPKVSKPLGLYHLARLDVQKGDKDAAINKLKQAREIVTAPGAASASYLKSQIDKLLGKLDPSAVPKAPSMPGGMPGMPGGGKLTKEQIEMLMKNMGGGGAGAPPGAPPGGP